MNTHTHTTKRTPAKPATVSPKMQAKLAAKALDGKKALDITLLSLVGRSSVADAMIVATGTSDRHVQTLAHAVVEALEAAGAGIIGVEGLESGWWVLVDTGDIIVHIFQEDARQVYRLEKLWSPEFDDENAAAEALDSLLDLNAG